MLIRCAGRPRALSIEYNHVVCFQENVGHFLNFWVCCRPYVTKIERGKTEDREQKVKELAQQVAAANLVHVKAQIAADTDTLRAKLPGKAEALAEHNLDMKYLRDRQTNLDVAV